ncbi:hypothetical protein C8J57DRAFT_1237560 [Mycena rebaudengoi]|nr:hypothetical protein C8J57DRAFT_1237560 [Mycena rebaudengoi]
MEEPKTLAASGAMTTWAFLDGVQLIRRPRSADLVPNSHLRATSIDLTSLIPLILVDVHVPIVVKTVKADDGMRSGLRDGRSQEDLSDVRCGADDDSAINYPLQQQEEEVLKMCLNSDALYQSLLLIGQLGEAGNLGVLKGTCSSTGIPNQFWFTSICSRIRGGRLFVRFLEHYSRLLNTCQVRRALYVTETAPTHFNVQTASSNKAEVMALAQDVGALAMAVAGEVEKYKNKLGADTELLEQISRLCLWGTRGDASDPQAFSAPNLNIYLDGQDLFKRRSFTWFTKSPKNEVILQRLQRSMEHSIDLFSLQSSIRIQRNLRRSRTLDEARKDRILDEIRAVCREVMDDIKTRIRGVLDEIRDGTVTVFDEIRDGTGEVLDEIKDGTKKSLAKSETEPEKSLTKSKTEPEKSLTKSKTEPEKSLTKSETEPEKSLTKYQEKQYIGSGFRNRVVSVSTGPIVSATPVADRL